MVTRGEELVAGLLNRLPEEEYTFFIEPTITHTRSAYRNPDFVVVGKSLGVLVIEVKDWKKITRAAQQTVEIVRDSGEHATEKNPLKIAKEYAHNLNERFEKLHTLLRKHKGKMKLKFPWMYAVALPHIERNVIQKCEDAWEKGHVFSKEDLSSPELFERALRDLAWVWRLEKPLSQADIDTIRGVLDPTVIIPDSQGQPMGVLTTQQYQIVHEPLKVVKAPQAQQQALMPDLLSDEGRSAAESASIRLIRGVAGSGKSLVLAYRALFLAEQNPDWRILILAFNKDLVRDLRRRVPAESSLQIMGFHEMCADILRNKWRLPSSVEGLVNNMFPDLRWQYGLDPEFVAKEIEWRKEMGLYDDEAYLSAKRVGRGYRLSKEKRQLINDIFNRYVKRYAQEHLVDWADVPFLALEELKLENQHPLFQSYDAALVDEAQDFAPSWIRVAKKLLKPEGMFFLCDDPTQSLFANYSWKEKGVDVVGRTRILRVPFRSTREVMVAAQSIITSDPILAQSEDTVTPEFDSYDVPSGEQPLLVQYRDLKDEISGIEEAVFNATRSGMPANQIAVLCHNHHLVKHWAHLRDAGVYVESFKKMKGLEFRMVLIPHVHTAFDTPTKPEDMFISERRRCVYTAMTRAREKLVISYEGKLPGYLDALQPYVQQVRGASYGQVRWS